jgi:urease accessory protein
MITRSEPQDRSGGAWISALLQLNDTFYPTGAYAHSFGLEGLIDADVVRDRDTLRRYLVHSVLPSLARVELPLVAQAYAGFTAADWERLERLSELSAALKSAKEARLAANNIGRQRAELCASLRQHPMAIEYARRAREGEWPYAPSISAALEACVIGAPMTAAMASVYYGTFAGLIAAAMKLLRLGQNGAQTVLTEMMSHSEEIIALAIHMPEEQIGWYNPWLDIAAARHETAAARLFIS